MNANVYAFLNNPELANRVTPIGTESEAAGAEHSAVEPIEALRNALKKVQEADNKYWESKPKEALQAFRSDSKNKLFVGFLFHTIDQVETMSLSSHAELEEQMQFIREKSPSWMRPSLEDLFIAMKERLRLNFARDYHSARNMVGRYETGLHFVGLNHFLVTIANLENFCRAEAGASQQIVMKPAEGAH
jgi:hypothetical protein